MLRAAAVFASHIQIVVPPTRIITEKIFVSRMMGDREFFIICLSTKEDL
jgi:hypothetical protein